MIRVIELAAGAWRDPDLIEWDEVKVLFLYHTLANASQPTEFTLTAVLKNENYIDIGKGYDAGALRQMGNRLSAERDKPLDDWTRPLCSLLTPREFFTNVVRATLRDDEPPPTDRRNGSVADFCFLRGGGREAFTAKLNDAAAYALGVVVTEGYEAQEAVEAVEYCVDFENHRFWGLCDANGRSKGGSA